VLNLTERHSKQYNFKKLSKIQLCDNFANIRDLLDDCGIDLEFDILQPRVRTYAQANNKPLGVV